MDIEERWPGGAVAARCDVVLARLDAWSPSATDDGRLVDALLPTIRDLVRRLRHTATVLAEVGRDGHEDEFAVLEACEAARDVEATSLLKHVLDGLTDRGHTIV